MSQMSNVSNPQFYSPEGSSHQDQFKSAQEKRVTPFDERSITPKSVASAHMDAFNQFQNHNDFPDWNQKPEQMQNAFPNWQQETPQSKGKQFGFDDFMNYDENQVSQSDGAGPDSQYEIQKHFGEQQSQPQRKQSRDINDIEDLMHQNSQNVSQQSQPFQKINEAEKFNYINPDQLPTDPIERQLVLKAQEIQPPNSHFPFLEGISPMIPTSQQMAFTFHDPNQFSMGVPPENKPPVQNQQQFIPSPHFEDIDSLFNQPAQPQQIDVNQNLNFHKVNSYPTQKPPIDMEMIHSQKSLKEQLPDPQQVKNQFASSPQLDHIWKFEQIVKQPSQSNLNNPFSASQQQPSNYSPIQSLEMIKQFQQLNMSSSSEKIKQQSVNNSQVNKNDDSELPWETSNNNKQTAINFLQDQWPNFDVYEVPQPKVDPKNESKPQTQPFFFEEPLQKQKSNSSLQEVSPQFNFPQQIPQKFDEVKQNKQEFQPVIQLSDQQFTQAISQPINNTDPTPKEETKQTAMPYTFNQFQFKDDESETSQKSKKSVQSQRSHNSIQSDPQIKQTHIPPQQNVQKSDDLFADWVNYQDPENMVQRSKISEPKSEEKEEEFYDVNQFDWDQYQKNQFLTTKTKENPPQIEQQQNQWQDTEEPKKTPRNEPSNQAANTQSGKGFQTPTQSPQFQSLNNSQNSQNEKKKNNPFIESAPETQDPKWENIPFFDDQIEINKQLPKPQPQEFKRQSLESIAEQDESMTQSMAIQQKNSALMQDNTMTEPKDNSIEESKVIPALKSYDIPSGQKGTHSVRESKDSNKETINAQQIVDQLLPKLGELIQKTSNTDKLSMIDNKVDDLQQRVEGQLSYLVEQMRNKDQKEQDEFGKDDYISQKVQMIEKLVEVYGQKLDSITKLLQEEKEKSEQKQQQQQSKVNLSIESQQMKKPISSPFDLNLDEHPDDSPIDNVINQNVPHSNLKVAQSNIQYNIGPKGFMPFQSQHQTHSRYINESQILENEANLIKFCTNFQFQKQALKGLQEYEIQNYRKQCLAEQTTLLDTYELIVTIISEVYQENEQQGLRIIITFKNKAQYELSNFIVMYNSNKIKDNLQITPQKISSQYLGSGETVRQEILFPSYDPSCVYVNCYIKYTINNFRQGYNFNRMSQTQGAYGMMNSAYSSQLSQSREIGQFRRNFSFQIARPANKFFEYNFHTSEDLKEYEMRCQSEQFYLRSLEELIIFHPWLIQIDQYTLGGKLFLRLPNSEHQFVIKIVSNRNQKCVIQMNEMDMDKKLTEHILTFLTFLFQKLY